jgi:hypothetical protein
MVGLTVLSQPTWETFTETAGCGQSALPSSKQSKREYWMILRLQD